MQQRLTCLGMEQITDVMIDEIEMINRKMETIFTNALTHHTHMPRSQIRDI